MEQFRNQTLSVSRLNQFENCELAFRFKYIDKLPEPPSNAAFKGSVVHLALEHLYGFAPQQRTLQTAKKLLEPALTELLDEKPENAVAVDPSLPWPAASYELTEKVKTDFLRICEELIANYFRLEDPSKLSPKAMEYRINGKSRAGHELIGYIDRLEESADGLIRISDYKTGAAPAPRYQAKSWFQLQVYAWLIQQETGVLAAELRLLYLKKGELLTTTVAPADIENVESRVIAIADAIDTAVVNRQFAPKEGPLCNFCSFQDLCPAKGGKAPNLPY